MITQKERVAILDETIEVLTTRVALTKAELADLERMLRHAKRQRMQMDEDISVYEQVEARA